MPRALAEEGCECNSHQYTCHVCTFDMILCLLSSTVNNTKPRDICQKYCLSNVFIIYREEEGEEEGTERDEWRWTR